MKDTYTTDSAAHSVKTVIPIAFVDHHSSFKNAEFWGLLTPYRCSKHKDAVDSKIKATRKDRLSHTVLDKDLGELTNGVPPLPKVQPEVVKRQRSYREMLEAARQYLKMMKR